MPAYSEHQQQADLRHAADCPVLWNAQSRLNQEMCLFILQSVLELGPALCAICSCVCSTVVKKGSQSNPAPPQVSSELHYSDVFANVKN